MSWLISRALMEAYANSPSSPGLVEEYSAANCSGGERFAPSSGTPMPRAFLPPDRMTAFSRPSRFGMTFGPLTDALGAELLTWFLAGFRAKTSALPEVAQALTASAPGCGERWRASLARFDPALRSWRTAQRSLLEDSDECSVTWPRSGMTADGQCWELPTLERPTAANDSGSWLPTPTANSYGSCQGGSAGRDGQPNRPSLQTMAARGMWPTPLATDGSKGGPNQKGGKGDLRLSSAVHQRPFPTPLARDAHNRSGQAKRYLEQGRVNLQDRMAAEGITGSLNPTWVEWLMGWPLGWTDLKPWETAKCLNVRLRHGGF